MNKKPDTALSDYKAGITSHKLETIHLFVPKQAAAKFRAVAKDSNMSASELFDKMVNSFVYGSFLDKENK